MLDFESGGADVGTHAFMYFDSDLAEDLAG